MRLALSHRQRQRHLLLCGQALRRNVGSGGLGHRWCSPPTAQQIPGHQTSTLCRSTGNELRREHPSRVASELVYARKPTDISPVLPCYIGQHQYYKAHVLVNVKAKVVLPAEAAQPQKDPAEIRTKPTSSLSITQLKNHFLALQHKQEFLSRTLQGPLQMAGNE